VDISLIMEFSLTLIRYATDTYTQRVIDRRSQGVQGVGTEMEPGRPGYESPGQHFGPGRVGSRVSVQYT